MHIFKSIKQTRMLLVGLVFIAVVQSAAVSILTDEVSQNSTYPNENEISAKNVDVFRQLLNQETIIRMNLVKNVHILMKDMLTLKEKLFDAEEQISGIRTSTVQEISDLNEQVELLKVENAALKNKTNADKTEIMLLKEKLVNVSNTLTDIKVEVRYLSITVFGMNDDFTKIDEKFQELENSTKEIETELRVNVKRNEATLSELETRHLTLIGKILFKKSKLKYMQYKLSFKCFLIVLVL